MSGRLRSIRFAPAAAALLALALLSLARADDPPPDLAVIVNPENRATVSPLDLEAIFLLKRRQWPDGTTVIPFNYPPGGVQRRAFDGAALRLSPDEAARYWLDQRIRSGIHAPRQIADAGVALRLVARLKGVIAYVPASMVDRSVRVVAQIRGGKVLPP